MYTKNNADHDNLETYCHRYKEYFFQAMIYKSIYEHNSEHIRKQILELAVHISNSRYTMAK